MSDQIIAAFIALGGTITGAFIGYFVSKRTTRIQSFYVAAVKLRLAFNDELAVLRHPEQKVVYTHRPLEIAFEKHHLAVIEFRYVLPKRKRKCFDKAWQNYYTTEDAPNEVLLGKYSPGLNPNGRENAIKNIEGDKGDGLHLCHLSKS